MKKVTLKEFKQGLGGFASKVARGERLEVTRYNKPYILILPAALEGLHVGKYVGKRELKPAIKGGTKGRALQVLLEDRSDR